MLSNSVFHLNTRIKVVPFSNVSASDYIIIIPSLFVNWFDTNMKLGECGMSVDDCSHVVRLTLPEGSLMKLDAISYHPIKSVLRLSFSNQYVSN